MSARLGSFVEGPGRVGLGELVGWLVAWLVGWLGWVGWLLGLLVGWVGWVGCLVGWLVGCLVVFKKSIFSKNGSKLVEVA